MKIIIIGAGIAGTSTYLHLTKHLPAPPSPSAPHTITIYESHRPRASPSPSPSSTTPHTPRHHHPLPDEPSATAHRRRRPRRRPQRHARVPGRSCPPPCGDRVRAQGFPVRAFHVPRGARGWKAGVACRWPMIGYPGEVCVGELAGGGCGASCGKEVGSKGGAGAVRYRRVTGGGGGGEEGVVGEESADLVVGADGVWSSVRKTLFGDGFAPKYTGLAGIGGFINKPLPEEVVKDKSMVFTFGRNGFFGYGSVGPAETNNMMWWSTYQSATVPNRKILDAAAVKKQLQDRHRNWKDPVIQDIIKTVDFDSINPTWTTPPLPHWGEKGLVLIGDSCHALPPTSGQGASQALEDSLTFSLALAHYLSKCYDSGDGTERDALEAATKVYYEVRQPRVQEIAVAAERMDGNKKDMGFVMEMILYGFIWLVSKYPWIMKMMAGDVNGRLYSWKAEEVVHKTVAKKDTASATAA
ncbi:FAD/NAD(P)-binding domain-containing protein [Cenococcum geophilum 1.58]|uniref:FAD/NAD(P)-binding domain-containing protein n=1 Tax=Cenococcum geophilum 1.58 TaxID=794803 RepID=UPI00358F4F2F|nr:FAD/NAD(P)-binding domain-containing protein [Cenococcum geophilum 1.58]